MEGAPFPAIAAIILTSGGHLVRDGWPPTGSTQLARAIGGLLCVLAALCILPLMAAAACGAAIWIGFYTDQKHSSGQGAATLTDAMYLAISGVTSLVPLAVAVAFLYPEHRWGVVGTCAAIGLFKPAIWFFWWLARPQRLWTFLEPTRCAAVCFGAFVGVVPVLVSFAR